MGGVIGALMAMYLQKGDDKPCAKRTWLHWILFICVIGGAAIIFRSIIIYGTLDFSLSTTMLFLASLIGSIACLILIKRKGVKP